VDRKETHKSSASENDQEIMVQTKSRLKKESGNDSVNYLSLFQLNPLLMHAASGVNGSQSYQQPTHHKQADLVGIKMEEPFADDLSERKNVTHESTAEVFESAIEQKLLNDTFDMINIIEASLHGNIDSSSGSDDNLSDSLLNNLLDENTVQFKIQLPSLLPKMHFVCEVGSRILFKSIDWLRDLKVWQHFHPEAQTEMLKHSWKELLVIGLSQCAINSPQSVQLKSMTISTLVNYVKSLIILSSNEGNNLKSNGKAETKSISGQKLKKMLENIMMINKFIDTIAQLDLDVVEFAHLRLLCLLNPNKCYSACFKLKVHYQKVAANLQNFMRIRESSNVLVHDRVLAIHQALSILPSMDTKIIEKLFFNILVDFVKIDNVIPYIINLNAETNERQEKQMKREHHDLEFNEENNSLSMNSDDQRYYNNFSGDEK
jgi:Ligand-binding domain of nuclear hormone receptor